MISIGLDHLRDFQKRTQYIAPNTTLPSLRFIKLDTSGGRTFLTKNNLQSVCVAQYPSTGARDHETILLDLNIFNSAINMADADTITISWDRERVYITDGATPMYFGREAAENFPATPNYQNIPATFRLGRGHLDCLQIARQFILDTETAGNYRFIHMGGEFISGIHTNFFYVNNRFTDLPTILVTAEMADVLCASSTSVMEFNFGATEHHYFFQTENVVYIFTQMEGKSPNIRTAIWDKIALPGKEFTIAKSEWVKFSNKANAVTDSELVRCTMDPNGQAGGLNYSMNDASKNRGVNKTVKVEGELDKFIFDSKLLNTPLKAIPYENLKCKMNMNNLIISSPDSRECFVFVGMGVM